MQALDGIGVQLVDNFRDICYCISQTVPEMAAVTINVTMITQQQDIYRHSIVTKIHDLELLRITCQGNFTLQTHNTRIYILEAQSGLQPATGLHSHAPMQLVCSCLRLNN